MTTVMMIVSKSQNILTVMLLFVEECSLLVSVTNFQAYVYVNVYKQAKTFAYVLEKYSVIFG